MIVDTVEINDNVSKILVRVREGIVLRYAEYTTAMMLWLRHGKIHSIAFEKCNSKHHLEASSSSSEKKIGQKRRPRSAGMICQQQLCSHSVIAESDHFVSSIFSENSLNSIQIVESLIGRLDSKSCEDSAGLTHQGISAALSSVTERP